MIAWFFGKKDSAVPQKEEGKDDFVSLSSHALRSPLSVIKWYTEILLDGDAGPLTEEQRKYLTVIESSNQRAIDLVRSLLNVSRLDLDTFSISPVDMSIADVVEEAIVFLKKDASQKNVTVEKEEKGAIKNIQADKHLCFIILKTLLSNAVAFSPNAGKVVVATTLIAPQEKVGDIVTEEESILVTVSDSGIGIPESEKPKIFSKMFRASNVKDTEGSDSGLGLYVVKTIIDRVGGKIWFSSTENVGTTFYVTFPTKGMVKKEGRTTLD